MEPAEAREHIEMVERILAESSQRLCYGAEYFVVWGLYSGIATVIYQLVRNGTLPFAAVWIQVVFLAAAILFSILQARAKPPGRRSIVDREFFNVLWLTVGLAFVANVGAFNIFRGWGSAGLWSFAEAVVLFFIGLHGNRRAQLAGIAVIVSLIAANFTDPAIAGYILAAGMVVGYAGFGLAEMLARD